jgi:putative tricarboxylic transport membrane protein
LKRPYQITALVCLLFALFVGWQSLRLPYYSVMGPGPGFFPIWLSVFFGLLAAVMFGQATVGVSEPMPEDFFPHRTGFVRIGVILGAMTGTILLIDPLGFRLTMFAFFLLLLSALSRHRLIVSVPIAAVGSFGVYQLFTGFLEIPLPIGIFGI